MPMAADPDRAGGHEAGGGGMALSAPGGGKHEIPYTIRMSRRARHIRLIVSPRDGVIVVLPRGMDEADAEGAVLRGRDWIRGAVARVKERAGAVKPFREFLPRELDLRAIGEKWSVDYRHRGHSAMALEEADALRGRLVFTGDTGRPESAHTALKEWLRKRARDTLVPRLARLARIHGFSYSRTQVRCQKTRWGSCSARGTISLNLQLLFLPARLADYVLIHELCHTVHLNHSPAFWELVARHVDDLDGLRADLLRARRFVPVWLW